MHTHLTKILNFLPLPCKVTVINWPKTLFSVKPSIAHMVQTKTVILMAMCTMVTHF